jgi:hypothetical protein
MALEALIGRLAEHHANAAFWLKQATTPRPPGEPPPRPRYGLKKLPGESARRSPTC